MSNEVVLVGFYIVILLYSVIIHEVAHGMMALWLGDTTAKYAVRLTANPLSHLDFVGSFLVPLFMYLSFGWAFGWAKPVPYNPYNLKNQKWGPALVGLAGPLSNFIVALIFAIIALVYIVKILKQVRQIAEKAETVVDSVETAASTALTVRDITLLLNPPALKQNSPDLVTGRTSEFCSQLL